MKKIIRFAILFFLATGCSVFGVRNEKSPKYEVIIKKNNIELRKYSSYIVASTQVDGSFKESQSKAFRILASYIFGDNEKKSKIAMTAPVIQQPTQTGWEMSFTIPSKYTQLEDLPETKDQRIQFKQIPSRLIAVIQFTGFLDEVKNQNMTDELKKWISELGNYSQLSKPMFAGYDPPWTLPFLRRNEIMIELAPQ